MKRFISLLLALIMVLCISVTAFAESDLRMVDDSPTYVTVFGLNQPFTDRIWAVSSQGYVSVIQVWDGGQCISGNNGSHIMEAGHKYKLVLRVIGVTGEIYINGVECWCNKSYGDYGTVERYVTGRYSFTTPTEFNFPMCGWFNPFFRYAWCCGWCYGR